MRAITLTGSLASGYTLGEALDFLENEAAGRPEVTAVGYRGESQSYKETGGSIALVLALTILLIYLLLAAQFESFVHPGVIITTVPLRSEDHTSELQSLMRISYAVFCLKKKKKTI